MAARFRNYTKVETSPPFPPPPPPSAVVSALPAINRHSLVPFSSACNSSTLPTLYTHHHHHHYIHSCIHVNQQDRRIRNGRCKAMLLHDAPFAGAIGACVLNSLIAPPPVGPNEEDDSMIDSADARFAVMGIISFIPYFNWMSWVFALMDTADKRYAAYAIVYLAPYIRSNFSLLPDESWLPIASILVGILHVQLEASIKNGDIQNFWLFNRKKEAKVSEQETRKD